MRGLPAVLVHKPQAETALHAYLSATQRAVTANPDDEQAFTRFCALQRKLTVEP
jgi:hypothetical protein